MSRFNVMPRAYRRQLQAHDQAKIAELTRTQPEQQHTGSAGRLRGIPAIGRGVAGAIAGSAPHQVDYDKRAA